MPGQRVFPVSTCGVIAGWLRAAQVWPVPDRSYWRLPRRRADPSQPVRRVRHPIRL